MTLVPETAAWAAALAALLPPDAAAAAPAFAAAVPTGYRERTDPVDAVFDLQAVLDLASQEKPEGRPGRAGQRLKVGSGSGTVPGSFRLRRVSAVPVELSALLPVLESFGLVVIEVVPQWLDGFPEPGSAWHADDISVRLQAAPEEQPGPDVAADGERFIDAFVAAATGTADVDSLNRLVITAGLRWPQVVVLRAYRRYLAQARSRWPAAALDDALASYPAVARALIAFVAARFDPAIDGRSAAVGSARQGVIDALAGVTHLQQDQILRGFLGLVDATVRTNAYVRPSPFSPGRALAIEMESARIPGLAPPRPRVETFVHAPEVEGIHLRAGLIARGGLRWSDRPDDVRTEVLGLAQAQVKKNAIIVPTGAKGGFVVRSVAPQAGGAAVRAAYETFVGALLDITDNIVDGRVVHPSGVVATDDDPYLVVAADRGTATFSDLANEISERRSFWLGDAFASGGSHGYDHKALGITARGAWVAVRRHFHQLGLDPETEPVLAAGVGDMSGDVFGNGMLQSRTLRLIAAFDHRHVFVDPDPDPEASFAERRRLAALDRSSWDDYDRSVLSSGGGVWPRDAKAIELSDRARRTIGVDGGVLTPPELIAAVLAAPVDLLWFGGIGTYVRASDESDADVGDRANDGVRITSDQLRARVVAEGGNLGVTQRARIRYARRGGRINTDFIDNAAGVAISDREVNCKILLGLAGQAGSLDRQGRDRILAEVTDDVVGAVLHQIDNSVVALSRAVPASATEIDAHEALLVALEVDGHLDREVECLPDADELEHRRQAGAGLIRPELAVLLAYAKSALVAEIEASTLPADPVLVDSVTPYFPERVRAAAGERITAHRLYPQLVATDVAGEVVDQMGVTWAHETAASLGRTLTEVAAAFWAARQVLRAGPRWEELVASTSGVFAPGADLDLEAHSALTSTVDTVARRYLARSGPVDIAGLIGRDREVAEALARGPLRPEAEVGRDRLVGLGADNSVAEDLARWSSAADTADVAVVAAELGTPPAAVAAVLVALDEAAGVTSLIDAVSTAGRAGNRWAAWQARALETDVRDWRAGTARQLLAGATGTPVSRSEAAVRSVADLRGEGAFRAVRDFQDRLGGPDDLIVAALAVRALPRLSPGGS